MLRSMGLMRGGRVSGILDEPLHVVDLVVVLIWSLSGIMN